MIALTAASVDAVVDDELDFHFRQQADVVFLAAVDRRVPLLLAVAAHFRHRHAGDAHLLERLAHVVDLVRPDDGLNQLHRVPPAARCRSAVSAVPASAVSLAPPAVMWKTSIALAPSVEINTRSTLQPCREMTRLMRCSSPIALLAMISRIV